jgi:succinyl-CoA synthetase beta subunit
MLNLYYVAAYSHRQNEWIRLMVSGPNADVVLEEVKENHPNHRISAPYFICETPDHTWKEI